MTKPSPAGRALRLALVALLAAARLPGPWWVSGATLLAVAVLALAALGPERVARRLLPWRLPALVVLAVLPAAPAALAGSFPWPILAVAVLALLPWASSPEAPAASADGGGPAPWLPRALLAVLLAAALLLPFLALRFLPTPTARLDELVGGGAWLLTAAALVGLVAGGALARHALASARRRRPDAPPEAIA